jgi:hypothetical protein
MKHFRLIATAALLTLAQAASASILVASDNFDYTDGSLVGKNGGTGWAGAWGPTTGPSATVVSSAAQFAGADNTVSRTLAVMQTRDVLVDFTLRYSGTLENNDFLALYLGTTTGPNIGLKGNCFGSPTPCANDLVVRSEGTNGKFLNGSDLTANTDYHVFGHLYKSANSANYDHFDAWIDPTAAEMSSLTGADAQYTGAPGSGIASFNLIGFRQANLLSSSAPNTAGVTVTIDSLKISNVPEPGTVALFGLALLGMAGARRRKSK